MKIFYAKDVIKWTIRVQINKTDLHIERTSKKHL
jgi:hypothetical protein